MTLCPTSYLLSATFPFVGLLVLVLFWAALRKYEVGQSVTWIGRIKCRMKAFWKDTFTIQNVFGGGVLGIVTFLYQRGNQSVSSISSQGFLDVLQCVLRKK